MGERDRLLTHSLDPVKSFDISLTIPDLWQQQALKALTGGRDVVVNAPTGAGKTFIFEQLVKRGLRKQAVYTVPTRALANDKFFEWRRLKWDIGIVTGDLCENPDAAVIVATLETQKSRLLAGHGPGILVIDEYQMMADSTRGINYELAIALAPPETQLLLLSGSVGNPADIVAWLQRIGRDVALVDHRQRPVPQEEVFLEALPDDAPPSARGAWPRLIGRALKAGLGPILVFAPRRRNAEALARQLAAELPTPDGLELSPEQRSLAGDPLQRLLRQRIAFHHSGLSYQQRAGLIEPLAKLGHLRVIVATTGLAAGINFCMKSVLVTDRTYQTGSRICQVRPDELLQMFGRAGRRGLDDCGYILVAPAKPRLNEARPLTIRRSATVDWPSLLAVMHRASAEGNNPATAAQTLIRRLFLDSPIDLGFSDLNGPQPGGPRVSSFTACQSVEEILNSKGIWERRRGLVKTTLDNSLAYHKGRYVPALQHPGTLAAIPVGTLCKLDTANGKIYGREVPLATFPTKDGHSRLRLVKWLYSSLCTRNRGKKAQRLWDLEHIEKTLIPLLPHLTQGGQNAGLTERNGLMVARLDYRSATVSTRRDSHGAFLVNPPLRSVQLHPGPGFAELAGLVPDNTQGSIAATWLRLGLVDANSQPTRRGLIFSFFNHAEGLIIAAALEDGTFAIADLIRELANIRAGHRFEDIDGSSSRLGDVARMTYGSISIPAYLDKGLPLTFGCGAAEVLAAIAANPARKSTFVSETLRPGDIQRAQLEWKSLLFQIAHAPAADWDRWMELKDAAANAAANPTSISTTKLPALTPAQSHRRQQ